MFTGLLVVLGMIAFAAAMGGSGDKGRGCGEPLSAAGLRELGRAVKAAGNDHAAVAAAFSRAAASRK